MTAPLIDSTIASDLPSPLLIIGPAYSGKSEFATGAVAPNLTTTVIGTASPAAQKGSSGLAGRLAQLRTSRPHGWQQKPLQAGLSDAVKAADTPGLILDSLNMWLGHLIFQGAQTYNDDDLTGHVWAELNEFTATIKQQKWERLVFVSAEVGAGMPPETATARLYRQAVSRINQLLAAHCQSVVYLQSGLPQLLKGELPTGRKA